MTGPARPVKAKVEVALAYEQRADAAASAVLRRLLEVIADDTPGAIAGDDPEHLHQLRIAVRRTRTVQRQLRRALPPLELDGYRSEFRWLQRATGAARDLDVAVEEFEELAGLLPRALRGDLVPLRGVLEAERARARAAMVVSLTSDHTAQLLEDWERLLESLVEMPVEDRPLATQTVGAAVGARVHRVHDRIVRMGEAIDADSPTADLHELRKKGKELRYLLELFAVPLFGTERVEPALTTLKSAQDVLGRHQDRVVQAEMLRAVADRVAREPGGARACMAMGALVQRLGEDGRRAREEFGERFAALREMRLRALFG